MKTTRKISIALVVVMLLMMTLAIIPASAAASDTVAIAGSFNGWSTAKNTVYDSTSGLHTFKVELAKGNHEFKIVVNGTWLGNGGSFTDTTITSTYNGGWDCYDGGNFYMAATGGTYIFQYNTSTKKVNVVYHTSHDLNVTTTNATCLEDGSKVSVCKTVGCGYTNTEVLVAPGHIYDAGVCTGCGAAEPTEHEHFFKSTQTKAPTCTEKGELTWNCDCGEDSYTSEVDPTGHTYNACGVCTVCDNLKADYTIYLAGYLNGADYEGTNYPFTTEGKLTVPAFTGDSYVYLTDSEGHKFMTVAYTDKSPATYVTTGGEKMKVPAGFDTLEFTAIRNKDGSITLSYEGKSECKHNWVDATCQAAKHCSLCDAINGNPVNHYYVDGKCTWCEDASETLTTIYVENELAWETVYFYSYSEGDDGEYHLWPGKAMTKGEDGLWYAQVPAKYEKIIFNNGLSGEEAVQTGNLDIPTTSANIFNNKGANWYAAHEHDYTYAPATCEKAASCECGEPDPEGQPVNHGETGCTCTLVKYYNFAGWEKLYCHYWTTGGASTEWPGNEMSKHEDGYYYYYIPASAKAEMVIFNKGEGGEGNQTADLTLDQAKNVLAVEIAGSFNEWTVTAMTIENGVAKITLELAAGTYDFKIIGNGFWLGNEGTINDTTITPDYNAGWDMSAAIATDCKLVAKGGNYTFTFYAATNKLNVEWECIHSDVETDADHNCDICGKENLTQHNYEHSVVVTDPTCSAVGYTTHTCNCGAYNVTDETEKLPHTIKEDSEYTIITLPTAEANGSLITDCVDCGTELTLAIPVLSPKYMTVYLIQYGTCETNKDIYSATLNDPDFAINGYIYVTFEIAHVYEHTEVEDAAVAATCTENGKTAGSHCSVCNEVLVAQTVITAPGHSFGDWEVIKEPTESNKGVKARTCKNCPETETGSIAELSHDHSRWDEITLPAKAATCTATGLTEGKKCSGCGEILVDQEIVPVLPHTEVVDAAVAATCTEAGKTEGKHCSVCDTVLVPQKTVAALGHTEVVDEGKAATCTEKGLTTGKHCSVCNTVLVPQKETDALGHDMVKDSAKAPTCTETGLTEGSHCSRCDYKVAQETVAALGHTEVVDAAVAATCTEAGKTEGKHCSVCKAVLVAQETVAALGHTEVVDAAVAATCTEAGKTEGKHCSVCNTVLVAQETVAALGHTEVVDAAVAATCTETGKTEGKHCSVCNEVLVAQEEIKAKGHSFAEGKCSVCGAADPDYVEPKPDDQQKPDNQQPEQPEEELGFFEAIWKAIVDFFKAIGDFFAGLFGGNKK